MQPNVPAADLHLDVAEQVEVPGRVDVGAAERGCDNEPIAVVDVGKAHTLIAVSLAVAGDEARWCFPVSCGTASRTCWTEAEDDVGRRAKFTEDEILDGAPETIAEGGPGGQRP